MRLNKLKEIAKENGCNFQECLGVYKIKKTYAIPNNPVIEISKKSINKIFTNNIEYCDDSLLKTFKACIEFAETPVNERIDILDDVEREYLSAVIRPFRNMVKYIVKRKILTNNEYICIAFKNVEHPIFLPTFKANTMYKNMVLDEEYTLEELGL